jgi:hypothetical protein
MDVAAAQNVSNQHDMWAKALMMRPAADGGGLRGRVGDCRKSSSPSYSPKLAKRATDVAQSRNSIHGSGCETESRID